VPDFQIRCNGRNGNGQVLMMSSLR
jgi:hypothetical protein